MQINRWLHLSRSLWEIPLCCDLFRKRTDQRKFPFTATNNWIVLAVQWPVEYSFAPNSLFEFPVIPEKWSRKEEEETQLQSVLLFKQTQKGGQWRFVSFYRISYNISIVLPISIYKVTNKMSNMCSILITPNRTFSKSFNITEN